jgi:hypothetical protein
VGWRPWSWPRQLTAARRLRGEAGQALLNLVRTTTIQHGHQRSRTAQRNAGRRSSSACSRHDADARFGLWSRRSGRRHRGSRRAAIGVRNYRGAQLQIVEDHDRRSCHRRPPTWGFHASSRSSTPRSSSQEYRLQISHGGSQGFKSPHLHAQTSRSERRQRRAGGARCMLRPRCGRNRMSQPSQEGAKRPGDSALVSHDDHGA